jgi:beta-lactamase regulating signal transducer with metallopeptidase domain
MFQWLIVHTVTTAVLAVIVLAASRWFRLGAAARHLLWLVVVVKFLTPPVVYWPWTLPRLASAPAVIMPTTTAPPVSAIRMVVIDMPPDFGPDPEVIDRRPLAPVAAAPAKEQPAAPPFSWDWLPATAGWTWLTGGVLVALLQAIRIFRWRLRLTKGSSAPDGLETLVRELAGAMGISPPRLIVLRSVASPMVWCFGLPRLLWPAGLEDRLSTEGCRAVLLHELAHFRRRDHWVGWLLLTGGCVWWWHPLFWWLRRRLGQEAELACDALVVGAAPSARRAYAEALLEVSQRMSAAVAVPALGAAGGRRDLERRLVMIMRGPASRRLSWVGLASAIALGLLALPAWTLGDEKTLPPQPSRTAPATAVTEAPLAPAATTAPEGSYYQPIISYRKVTTSVPVTSYQLVSPANTPVAPPTQAAATDRDQKMKELEDKVQQLLKEMQQLRGQAPMSGMPPLSVPKLTTTVPTPQESMLHFFLTAAAPQLDAPRPANPPTVTVRTDQSSAEVITLTRVSYKLTPATAEALSTFLKDNVKTAILETKSEGESLVVTTTPDAQKAIGQFVHLLQGPKTGPTPMKSMRPQRDQPPGATRPPLAIDPSPSLEPLPPLPAAEPLPPAPLAEPVPLAPTPPAPPAITPPSAPQATPPAAPGSLPVGPPPTARPFSLLGQAY